MFKATISLWTYLLLLSFSTQVLSVVLDSHASHQSTEHAPGSALTHIAAPTNQGGLSQLASVSTGKADKPIGVHEKGPGCQHCCHCHHNVHHVYLPVRISALPVFVNYSSIISADNPPNAGFLRDLLRPPIA